MKFSLLFAHRRAGAGLALSVSILLAACSGGKSNTDAERPAPEVGYVVAMPSAVPLPVTLGGRTVAFETSEVRPQVTGVIRKRLFTEGSYVKAGQPLYQIDPSLFQAAVNQAQANLSSAQASAEAAVARANRFRPLAEMEAIAAQDYTDAAAQARVARAGVSQNAAALETARINLRFTTVPAPISGRIGRSLVTVGALAGATQETPLAIIQSTNPIFVDMQQSAAELVNLRRKLAQGGTASGSAQVQLKFDDGSNYAATGTVQFSEVTVNESTGTVTLRARFPNPDGLLLPGMFVNAVFNQSIDTNAYLVPQQAMLHDFDGSAYVFVVGKDNKAERRKVTAERSYGANWVVTAGLKKGDKVITQGLNGLKQGAATRPVPASRAQKVIAPKDGETGNPGAAGKAG